MGVRPPSDDSDDSPDVIEFGIAALDARLSDADVSFPATETELRASIGDERVPYDASGHELRLADAFDDVDRSEFETEQELLNAMHPVFEHERERASRSFVAQLRRLVPF
jgi:hypothetical protein